MSRRKNLDSKLSGMIVPVTIAFIAGLSLAYFMPSFSSVNKTEVTKNIKEYLIPGQDIKIKDDTKNIGEVSEVKIDLQGQELPIYVSNDGKIYFQKILDVAEIEKQKKVVTEVKSIINDSKEAAKKSGENFVKKAETEGTAKKPKVDLFVMSYCPFGTQAEKGFLPAIEKLGDKIDARIKFVNYVMHPDQQEGEQNFLQYCIQETQPQKYRDYLNCFLEEGKTADCFKKANISMEKVGACLNATETKFNVTDNLDDKSKWLNGRFPKFKVQDDLNQKYGVQGSPTLVINGKQVNAGRSPQEMLNAICATFDEKNRPAECKEKLSTETPKSGFGKGSANQNQGGAGGCGA